MNNITSPSSDGSVRSSVRRTALVTGVAPGGIGEAVALALSKTLTQLVVHDKDEAVAIELARRITAEGCLTYGMGGDFSQPAVARNLAQQACERVGRLDILVANAGMTQRCNILELTDDDMIRVISVNLLSSMALTQECAKHMVKNEGGCILIVSSVNEDLVIPQQAHYCASKGGLRQWARAMAVALGPKNVRVNLVCPGAIDTPMNRGYLNQHPEREE
jgi:glucose 1-dehydrogenase